MRTTLRIDDDLMILLRKKAHREGVVLTELVNRLIRCGMEASRQQRRQRAEAYRERVFSMGEPAVNLNKALALAAVLEDEEVLEKLARRK